MYQRLSEFSGLAELNLIFLKPDGAEVLRATHLGIFLRAAWRIWSTLTVAVRFSTS